jgi:hypothetical protein
MRRKNPPPSEIASLIANKRTLMETDGMDSRSRKSPALLALSLGLLVVFAFCESFFGHSLITGLGKISTMEEPAGSFAIPPGAYQQTTILPPASMDMRWWILHAQSLLESDSVRIRETRIDNAPQGREVHWHSGLIWLIAGLARLMSFFIGRPAVDCATWAAIVTPLLLLTLAVAGMAFLVSRRLGWGVAGVFVLILFTSRTVHEGFVYGMVDHHGIVLAFAIASVLALAFSGAGLVNSKKTNIPFLLNEASARRWMILSGILGGAALWVSAATAIPVIAGCGLGALVAAWSGHRTGIPLKPDLWRSWGLAGCLSSLFFYALEYFPSRMGWRLEVNHPLYAFAWLAAADLLTRLLTRFFGKGRLTNGSPTDALRLALGVALVLLPAAMAATRPDLFFYVSDRFLLALHNEHINEFQPLWVFLFGEEGAFFRISTTFIWPLVVLLGIPLLLCRKHVSPVWRALAFFLLCPVFVMQALAFSQIRWQGMATGLWLLEILMLIAAMVHSRPMATFPRRILIPLGALSLVAAVWHPQAVFRNAWAVASESSPELPKQSAPTVLLRDVAHRLLQASPRQIPVVVAGPNSSTDLSYYGHIHTLGTLYWENVEGLKKAARIFAAPNASEALRLINEAGATHIVIASWDDFGMDYVSLLKKSGEISEIPPEPFVKSLLDGAEPPDWIRPLFYPIPPVFGLDGAQVRIFAVMPNQSPLDALIHRGIYQLDAGNPEAAKKIFQRALESSPGDPRAIEGLKAAEALPAKP